MILKNNMKAGFCKGCFVRLFKKKRKKKKNLFVFSKFLRFLFAVIKIDQIINVV